MPSRIDDNVRRTVVWHWIRGGKPEKVASECNISYGTVRNIVKELRDGRYPEYRDSLAYLDDLRWLSQQLTSRHRTLQQALGGHLLLEELLSIRVDPAELSQLLRVLRKLSPSGFPRDVFAKAALRIVELEEELGVDFVELEKKAGSLRSDVAKLEKTRKELEITINAQKFKEQEAVQSLNRTLNIGKQEIQRLEQSKASQLAGNKLTEERLTKYLQIHGKLVFYGISFEKLDSLVKILEEFERHGMQPNSIVEYVARINSLSQQVGEWTRRIALVQKEFIKNQETLGGINSESTKAKADLARLENEKKELLAQLANIRKDYDNYSLHIDLAQTLLLLLNDPSKATDKQLLEMGKKLAGIVDARKSLPQDLLHYDQLREMMVLLVGTVAGKTLVFKEAQDRELTALRNMNSELQLGWLGKLRGEKQELRREMELFELTRQRFAEAAEDQLLEIALGQVKKGATLLVGCKTCGTKVAIIPGSKKFASSSFTCPSCLSTLEPLRNPLPVHSMVTQTLQTNSFPTKAQRSREPL